MNRRESVAPGIRRDANGVYTWTYQMSLFKNPTVFFLIWKIFFFILLGVFAVTTVVDAIEWSDFFPDRLLTNLTVFGWILLGMTGLVGLSYLLYAAIMGGTYTVLFEMDEHRVTHRQIESQAKKARRIGAMASAAGWATGNLTTAGVGMNAVRTEMVSEFAAVRTVKLCPHRHLIKVNGRLSHNQVYAAPEDFDFVAAFIRSHCPNVKS